MKIKGNLTWSLSLSKGIKRSPLSAPPSSLCEVAARRADIFFPFDKFRDQQMLNGILVNS